MAVTFREAAAALSKGLAQLVLADRVSAGLLVLIGLILISPWGALGAVAGAAFGTVAGRLVTRCPHPDWDHGIAGFNCAIVGIFWAGRFAQGDFNLPLFLTLLSVCVAVETGLRHGLAPIRLPVLSLPAVVTLLAASLVLAPHGAWFWVDTPASSFGPVGVIAAFVCFAVAMGTKSVTAAAWSVILGVSCYLAVKLLGHDTAAYSRLWAVNIPLAVIAMTGVFLRDTALGPPAGALAAAVAGIVWLIWTATPVSAVAPPLLAPYVVGVWCAIIVARRLDGLLMLQPAFWRAAWAIGMAHAEGRTVLALVGGDTVAHGRALEHLGGPGRENTTTATLASAEQIRTSSRWRRGFWLACAELRDSASRSDPTELHSALAAMERRSLLDAIVTQDDGAVLRVAGARQVIGLHGPVEEVACLDCGTASSWPPGSMWRQCDLLCSNCGGLIVPRGGVLRAEIVPATHELLDSRLADCGVLLLPGGIIPHPAVEALFKRLRAAGSIAVLFNDGRMPRTPDRRDLRVSAQPARALHALGAVAGAIKLMSGHRIAPRSAVGGRHRRRVGPMIRMIQLSSAVRSVQRLWLVVTAAVLFVVAAQGWLPNGNFGLRAQIDDLADGRAGRISFRSYTPAPGDVETGTFKYGAVTVTGELTLPNGLNGQAPAAVLLHGSNGVSNLQHQYAERLADWGVATFVLDSFTPRGVRSTVGNQGAVSPHAMMLDAYAAMNLLARHPRIDPDRIVLIGWSKGGTAAELAARRRYRDRLASDGRRFAAHVAIYPWCGAQESEIDLTGAPLLFLLGAEDDWTGAQACQDLVGRLRKLNYPARAIVYRNAEHGFDGEGQARTYLTKARSWIDCRYFARKDGFVVARDGRFEPWSRLSNYFEECSQPGAHVGANPQARARAREDLKRFLTSVFDLR